MVQPWLNKILEFIGNYLGHPLFIPLYAYGFYYLDDQKNHQPQENWIHFIVIFLLLVLFPLLIYPLLRKENKVQSIHLKTVRERIWPLGINLVLWSSIICYFTFIIPQFQSAQINPTQPLITFFLGGAISIFMAMIMAILGHKSSLHMMGVSGLALFFILKYSHDSNLNTNPTLLPISLGIIAILWVGLARYNAKAHSAVELVTGFAAGALSQVLALNLYYESLMR